MNPGLTELPVDRPDARAVHENDDNHYQSAKN
jgi:hypothetical protein